MAYPVSRDVFTGRMNETYMHRIVIPSTTKRSQSPEDSKRLGRISHGQAEMMTGQFGNDGEA